MSFQTQSRGAVLAWLENDVHKDATLRFGNHEDVVGPENITEMYGKAYGMSEKMKHDIVDFDLINNKIYLSIFITYVVKNDPEKKAFKIPAIGIMHLMPEGRKGEAVVRRFEGCLDFGPVLETIERLGALEGN